MTKKVIQKEIKEEFCDHCNKKGNGAYTLICGYGSHADGLVLDFCSENCLKKYVDKNVEYLD